MHLTFYRFTQIAVKLRRSFDQVDDDGGEDNADNKNEINKSVFRSSQHL